MNIITGETTENMETTSLRTQSDVKTKISKKVYIKIKRVIDVILASVALILLSPLFAIIAIAIKIDSKGPVFFAHKRIGKNGKIIKLYKFRSMVINAEELIKSFTPEQMREYKENYKLTNDPRITKIGNFLRKTSLDELPQVINILKGEMTFVGTRPEVKKYVDKYTDEMMATLLMPAGVTSIASIKYKDEDEILDKAVKAGKDTDVAYVEDVLLGKMKYNLEYLKQFSVLNDLKICIDTVIGVLK